MNLHQCETKAKKIGFNKAKFVALFPCGPVNCQWLDAYMGIFRADVDGLRNGFLMTSQIDQKYPDLYCSEPYVEGDCHDERDDAPLELTAEDDSCPKAAGGSPGEG